MILRSIGGHSLVVLKELENQFGEHHIYTWSGFNHYQDWPLDAFSRAILDDKIIICAETPLIGRHLFDRNDSKSYYRVGLNAVSTQQYKNFNLPDKAANNRLMEILDNTGTELKKWRTEGEHILYAMQVPADSSLSGLDIFAAAQYDLVQIRLITKRPIKISLHPDLKKEWGMDNFKKNSQHFERFKKIASLVGAEIQIGGSRDSLENCWCVVCHTSGFGFDSLAEGIPVITLSEHSFISPICSHSIYDIESPLMVNANKKIEWLSRISYCQWTIDEIKNGAVKKHLAPILN